MNATGLLRNTALPLALCWAGVSWAAGASAQDLPTPAVPPPTTAEAPAPDDPDQVQFSAGNLEYDTNTDVVTATGDVRMARRGDRLRADRVVWNRKTGKVVATGNIAVTNPQGDVAYGDSIDLTDSLRDGVVENMLVVLDEGGRLAAARGTRDPNGVISLDRAAYTPCPVVDGDGCPKEPSWKITAVKVVYDPGQHRIRYTGGRLDLLGLVLPLPPFSHPIGGGSDNGFLAPDLRYDRTNGIAVALPYYFGLAPNRDLTLTPRLYSDALPLVQAQYRELNRLGAYQIEGWGTYSRRSDDLNTITPLDTENAFRGYLNGNGRFQLDPNWSVLASLRVASDRTFLRRYDISRDDRLRNVLRVQRIDRDSLLSISGWAVQTLRVADDQGLQPVALPEIDYRRRLDVLGGRLEAQVNTLAIGRSDGQDTQRAFASARWDLRRLTPWGQEVVLTAYARGDVYNASDTLATTVASYRGREDVEARGIGALALDLRWPLIGPFPGGGTQRVTPRFQVVASPRLRNLDVPNEDARAVDLEDSNLFSLNRFPGYDRFEDSTRFTYGVDWAVSLPGFSLDANVGQSYRLGSRPTILPEGTGLSNRTSDIVGRTEVRFRDFVSLTHRYRLDKDDFAFRRNELDATIGSRQTYLLVGYLRLDRNITSTAEDLQDREEVRAGGRVHFARYWSVFGSAVVDLTDRNEDVLALSDGFAPVRHRLGVDYQDDCLELGLTWKRDYQNTGDARRGNSFLLTLALRNLGR